MGQVPLFLIASSVMFYMISPILLVHVYPVLLGVIWGGLEYFNIKPSPKLEIFLGVLYISLAGTPAVYFILNAMWWTGGIFTGISIMFIYMTIISYRRAKKAKQNNKL